MNPPKLVFVYNADDGLFNAIAATAHRIFSPATYECFLCRYTYGVRGMHREWKRFLESLACSLDFFYRNEFRAAHPQFNFPLPAVLVGRGCGLELLIASDEIKACGCLEELILFTRRKVEWACPGWMESRKSARLEGNASEQHHSNRANQAGDTAP
jgi:hypothetical protein